ncbi:HNH endonuclease [Aliidiomarina indica]|uniref:HNH endonuclease n=1 Tax=Aliidiomarina indica TaxID=2749147 RepID=UPI0018908F6B|nr:HNH endonuclease signature motif containing protein [Aliidiomarina indica]
MKINSDFSGLESAVARLQAEETSFRVSLERQRFNEIDTLLGGDGIDVSPEEIDFSTGIAAFKGRQVLLYIPDHSYGSMFLDAQRDGSKGNKFHVTWCGTLENMQKRNRFKRYTAVNDLSGKFKIFGSSNGYGSSGEVRAELAVCQTCLSKLNYKGARDFSKRQKITDEFSIPEFFETYSSFFKYMPSSFAQRKAGYSDNWKSISNAVRVDVGYTCQSCDINLKSHPYLLHVHHINGVKHDNNRSNLKALCADCHRKEPLHDHMHVSREDMAIISHLRNKTHQSHSVDWTEAMAFADPAVHGVLDLAKSAGWPMPETGFEPQNDQGEVIGMIEAAWPNWRLGVVLVENDKFELKGWRLMTVEEALSVGFKDLR